jgi:DeoR/GlpR family transcriptional regulator of sugar metabolism
MLDAERRQQIVAFVDERHGATVAELGRRFGVSDATVRRDLLLLSRQGLIERAHGGAAPRRIKHAPVFPEPPILDRAADCAEEKRRIGRAAASLVADGDTIMIAGGTTTAHMIPHLAERTGLTVVTNNLNVAGLLAPYRQITVIVVGGVLRHSELSLLGTLAEDALENLRVDRLYIGSSAIHVDYGLSADDPDEVQTDRALMATAREITVLADHTKFDRIRTIRVVPMSRVSRVVTDSGLSVDQRTALERLGIAVDVV